MERGPEKRRLYRHRSSSDLRLGLVRGVGKLGNPDADLCLLRECQHGYVAGPGEKIWLAASRARGGVAGLTRLRPLGGGWTSVLKALRPHQWAKNLLIGVPLLVSHQLSQRHIAATIVAFVSFSLIASCVYVINDLLDLASDRLHPTKVRRPFASGAVSIPVGLYLATGLFLGGLLLAYWGLDSAFGGIMVLYLIVTTLYSTILKRKIVLDVFVLGGLYTIRILAGAVAIKVEPSEWLLAFSMFIFISLAMVKRYSELKAWSRTEQKWPAGRRYTVSDMELFRSIGPASAYAAVLVFALYISSANVSVLYKRPPLLWLVCPVLLYWLTRLWFLTNRSRNLEDPVLFALTDRASLGCGLLVFLLVFAAT